eukprot:455049-Rhodomonas_salina.1
MGDGWLARGDSDRAKGQRLTAALAQWVRDEGDENLKRITEGGRRGAAARMRAMPHARHSHQHLLAD